MDLQVLLHLRPIPDIRFYVLLNSLEVPIIPDDMFVIISLPDMRPRGIQDFIDLFCAVHFEIPYNQRKGHPASFLEHIIRGNSLIVKIP